MTWLIAAWRFIAGSRIVQGAALVGSLIAYHLFAKWRAGNEAVREERERSAQQAREQEAEHSGDIHAARQELDEQQQERREREREKNPRSRFGRDPFE